jgi:hypothetical protein
MSSGIPTTNSIGSWNRATKHVEQRIRSGQYVNSETTLICAGPPLLGDMTYNSGDAYAKRGGVDTNVLIKEGENALYPVGAIEQFSLHQTQAVTKTFEIGARRSYQAPGRVNVAGSLGRVLFRGNSLLRVLMAYYPNTIQMANGRRIGPQGDADSVSRGIYAAADGGETNLYPPIHFEAGSKSASTLDDEYPDSFMINLMSELFSHPFGLALFMLDTQNRPYGAFYLEDCFIQSHQLALAAASNLITESVAFQADAAVPIEIGSRLSFDAFKSYRIAS